MVWLGNTPRFDCWFGGILTAANESTWLVCIRSNSCAPAGRAELEPYFHMVSGTRTILRPFVTSKAERSVTILRQHTLHNEMPPYARADFRFRSLSPPN